MVSRQTAAPGAAQRSRVQSGWMGAGSGGGLEGDLVAEGFELADVVALGAVGVDAGVVEAGAQVTEAGGGVGQQVPDDDQDGPADRHDRLVGAATASDPPVALPKEGIGPPGSHGGLAEHPGEVGLPCPVVAVPSGLPADSLTPGGELGPRDQVPGGWEPGHVGPDLGDEQVRGELADPTDLIQPLDRPGEAGDQRLDPGV